MAKATATRKTVKYERKCIPSEHFGYFGGCVFNREDGTHSVQLSRRMADGSYTNFPLGSKSISDRALRDIGDIRSVLDELETMVKAL